MPQEIVMPIRPEIRAVLGRLRRRIRQYVLIEGTALVLVVLGFLFWFSVGVDWAYFRLSNFELPRWFRAGFDVLSLCLVVLAFMVWVALRYLHSLRTKALALVLEKRFPELDDRLITAVEAADSTPAKVSPLTVAMLNQTIDDVARHTGNLQVTAVFEKRPLRRAVTLAAILCVSIAGYAWANQQALVRWKQGYYDLLDGYWDRETTLVVKVVAQPGDRVKSFKNFEYKHPRGGDLTLLIEVPDEKKQDGSEWKVPDRVQLKYRLAGGRGSGRVTCAKVGMRQFKYSAANQLDGMQFWVTGGDYTDPRPYRVIVVDPPRIDQITLQCDYPPYTGLNDDAGTRERQVQGTQISLPMETTFLMHATSNKPLVHVRIQYGQWELAFGDVATLIRKTDEDKTDETIEIPRDVAAQFLAADRLGFTLPFVLSAGESEAARQRAGQPLSDFGQPFAVPPDSLMRIYLSDTDDITSSDPSQLTLNGTIDYPPAIESELRGLGRSITRKAVVPVVGLVSDDYGVVTARFDFKVDDEASWRARPFRNSPDGNPKEYRLQRSERQQFEQFEVLPLDLTIGQKLTLTVYAEDGDTLNGPHSSRSEKYNFKIVSNEELLSILYGKELNLRRRFEQIIKEVVETRNDLILHRSRVQEAAPLRAKLAEAVKPQKIRDKLKRLDAAVAASAERALHQVRKNANETKAIEESFREILEELVNNAVHTRQMVERIDGLIVKPLHLINTIDYPTVDERVSLFRLANEKGRDPTPRIDDSVKAIDTMLAHMKNVLDEIQDLAEFHEALAKLKSIIDDEENLTEQTKSRRKKDLIKKLGLDD